MVRRKKNQIAKRLKAILSNSYFVGLMAIALLIFAFYGCYTLIRKADVTGVWAIILTIIWLVVTLGIIWSYEKEA